MKIQAINFNYTNPLTNNKNSNNIKKEQNLSLNILAPFTQPSFKSHRIKYLKAKEYLVQENLKRQSKGAFEKFQNILPKYSAKFLFPCTIYFFQLGVCPLRPYEINPTSLPQDIASQASDATESPEIVKNM